MNKTINIVSFLIGSLLFVLIVQTSLNQIEIKNSQAVIKNQQERCGSLDVNSDNSITLIDFSEFAQIYLTECGQDPSEFGPCGPKDFDGDNAIGLADFLSLARIYNLACSEDTSPSPTPAPSIITPIIPISNKNSGIWISQEELEKLSASGAEWDALYSEASGSWGNANVSDQDSNHDTSTLAGALVCSKTGEFCDKSISGLKSAIGTEEGSRWLAIGRNLTSYAIAADVLKNSGNLQGQDLTDVTNWLGSFLTRTLSDNNSSTQEVLTPFESGSNASAQEGAVYISIAAFLDNQEKLEYAWNRFRLYSCDKVNNPETEIGLKLESGWSHDPSDPCAVNPIGTEKEGHRIDGAIINDIRRGSDFTWPPTYTSYPWVGMEGYVPSAVILHRSGYPAFEIADQSVFRAADFLYFLRNDTGRTEWFDGKRSNEIVYLINYYYGVDFPMNGPTGGGRTLGYTGWTHQ